MSDFVGMQRVRLRLVDATFPPELSVFALHPVEASGEFELPYCSLSSKE